MGLFAKKYIYVSVCFPGNSVPYYYRTDDRRIGVNDIVIVPTGNEPMAARVVCREVFREKDLPYPAAQTKEVLRKAGGAERRAFRRDARMQRAAAPKTGAGAHGRTAARLEGRRRARTGRWYREEHLWGGVTYRCSRCGTRVWNDRSVCPGCGSANQRVKSDPAWVDEMSMYDGE